jgi:hypothetical protein
VFKTPTRNYGSRLGWSSRLASIDHTAWNLLPAVACSGTTDVFSTPWSRQPKKKTLRHESWAINTRRWQRNLLTSDSSRQRIPHHPGQERPNAQSPC